MTRKKRYCPVGHDAFEGGRDRSGRCLICRAEAEQAKAVAAQAAIAERLVAFERRRAEADRRREREYRAAIRKGGDVAREARWQRAFSEALERGHGLCQWQDGVSDVHVCNRREAFAGGVYCRVHDHRLQRETRAKERTE